MIKFEHDLTVTAVREADAPEGLTCATVTVTVNLTGEGEATAAEIAKAAVSAIIASEPGVCYMIAERL